MRAAVGTVLAVMFGGGLSLFAGAASPAAPARAATPAAPHALPRAALATTVPASADCTIDSGAPASASQCGAGSDDTVGADGNGALYRTSPPLVDRRRGL